MQHSPSVVQILPQIDQVSDLGSIGDHDNSFRKGSNSRNPNIKGSEDFDEASNKKNRADSKKLKNKKRSVPPINYGINAGGQYRPLNIVQEDIDENTRGINEMYPQKGNFVSLISSP